MLADPPRRTSQTRSNPWRGASTNGPSSKADDVIIVESKDYKEAKNKHSLTYGTCTRKRLHAVMI